MLGGGGGGGDIYRSSGLVFSVSLLYLMVSKINFPRLWGMVISDAVFLKYY